MIFLKFFFEPPVLTKTWLRPCAKILYVSIWFFTLWRKWKAAASPINDQSFPDKIGGDIGSSSINYFAVSQFKSIIVIILWVFNSSRDCIEISLL